MFRKLLCLSLIVFACFFAVAGLSNGQLLKRNRPSYGPTILMPHTCPSCECSPNVQAVPQPSLRSDQTEPSFSPAQVTASDGVSGTGLRLPIGNVPKDLTFKLHPEATEAIKSLSAIKLLPEKLHIIPPMSEETTQRLSRDYTILQVLLWLLIAIAGHSAAGRYLQLAARVVSGLQSASGVLSAVQKGIAEARSSMPTQASSVGSQAEVSSTEKPKPSSA